MDDVADRSDVQTEDDRSLRLRVAPTIHQPKSMTGERELTTGLLSKGAGFRLIVHGKVGEKELDRLIRKLQLDKEILADGDDLAEEVEEES